MKLSSIVAGAKAVIAAQASRLMTGPTPLKPSKPAFSRQQTNPVANQWRKVKRSMGARKARKLTKAHNRAAAAGARANKESTQ